MIHKRANLKKRLKGKVTYDWEDHAKDRMKQRHINSEDIIRVINKGKVVEACEDIKYGGERLTIEGSTVDSNRIKVVISLDEEEIGETIVEVITVFKVKTG